MKLSSFGISISAAALIIYATISFGFRASAKVEIQEVTDDAGARAAFLESYKVFSSPRCVNCHPAGNRILQGEDSHPDELLTERGKNGRGFSALRCNACHQNFNSPGEHAPPGAEDWHLPPPEFPMPFQGKSIRQLCEQLKDRKQNGNRTLRQVGDHLDTALVRWAWAPGGSRSIPPIPYKDFVEAFERWRDKGGACPE